MGVGVRDGIGSARVPAPSPFRVFASACRPAAILLFVSQRMFSARSLLQCRRCWPPCVASARRFAPTRIAFSTVHRGVGAIGVPDLFAEGVRLVSCPGSNVHTAAVPLVHKPSPPPTGSSAPTFSAPPGTHCSPVRAIARSPGSSNALRRPS